MSQTVLLTGANGFVGHAVSRALLRHGSQVAGIVRRARTVLPGVQEWVSERADFEGIGESWPDGLRCDAVVHLAARVHVLRDAAKDPLAAYRATNVEGTLRVAEAARLRGARRLVFVSSVKAVAERSSGQPIAEDDAPAPTDPYGISKLEAERALVELGARTGLEIVVVRPPLVYGPGVRANFLQLMRGLAMGAPLPLGSIGARRSLVFVDNLADALLRCTTDPRAAGQTFHVTDGEDLSVAGLARLLAELLHAPARLLPVPVPLLRLAGRLTGRSAQVGRLVDELLLDSSRIGEVLGWRAPCSVREALRETADWYRSTH